MGFDSPPPRSWIPYSVSRPHTFLMATRGPYPHPGRLQRVRTALIRPGLQVLASGHALDRSPAGRRLGVGADEGPDEHDPLALLARDLGPVVRVGGVRKILVLLVLLLDRVDEVLGPHALGSARDVALDGELLGPAHDVLDHGA